VEGELVWADAAWLKVRGEAGSETVVRKSSIKSLEALDGTDRVSSEELRPDLYALQARR